MTETIGQKLKAAREKQKMTAADVAKAVRIKTEYVAAIEKNEFHKLIAPIYAKGFIKLYAQCVRIEYAPLLRQFDAGANEAERPPDRQEQKLQARREPPAPEKRQPVMINFAGLIDALRKIKLPDISRWNIPALKPVELPGKKWLVFIVVVAICLIILPLFIKHCQSSDAGIQVPPAGRWITDPPEPYLDIPAPKSQNNR